MGEGVLSARVADADTGFGPRSRRLFGLMLGIFFGGGLLASVEALLVPRLQLALGLGYAKALLVQLVYYAGYLIFAIPATVLTAKFGVARASAAGLATMAAGCAAFALAQASLRFEAMLAALSLLSAGVTVLQIACNGAMATLGSAHGAVSRFTLLQGFNAIGTVIGPLAAAWFLLGDPSGGVARIPFVTLAIGFAALALAMAANRDLLPARGAALPGWARVRAVLAGRRTARGTAAIFAYVGAEVTIGTLAVGYLMAPDTLGVGAVAAGRMVSLYWAGAMAGRFAGAWALRRIAAPRLLAAASAIAVLLIGIAVLARGPGGATALLCIGLCNSIMFPTIYALAMPALEEDVPVASMLLCMAVVGGAVVPMATGLVADRSSLAEALALPAICYAAILVFARAAAGDPEPA